MLQAITLHSLIERASGLYCRSVFNRRSRQSRSTSVPLAYGIFGRETRKPSPPGQFAYVTNLLPAQTTQPSWRALRVPSCLLRVGRAVDSVIEVGSSSVAFHGRHQHPRTPSFNRSLDTFVLVSRNDPFCSRRRPLSAYVPPAQMFGLSSSSLTTAALAILAATTTSTVSAQGDLSSTNNITSIEGTWSSNQHVQTGGVSDSLFDCFLFRFNREWVVGPGGLRLHEMACLAQLKWRRQWQNGDRALSGSKAHVSKRDDAQSADNEIGKIAPAVLKETQTRAS